ncbi:MAG: ATP-binding protein, partial [Candidatus Methanospirareceae archaeon]
MIPKHNLWWRDPSEIFNDEKIKEFEAATIQWKPRIRYYINFDKDKIYTLRGPRQVGKTTLIKLMIKDLLTGGEDSKSIFYYSCDLVTNEKELFEVINEYLDWALTFRLDRKYIFLDEISSVKDWEKGLKYLVDAGILKNTSVILTGSHSIDIKHSIERLPGRRGEGD